MNLEVSSLVWHGYHSHGVIATLKKSLTWEKKMIRYLLHKNHLFDVCNILIPWKESCEVAIGSDEISKEKHMVPYVIIQCVAIYCIKVCVNICERVVWYNDYCIKSTLE